MSNPASAVCLVEWLVSHMLEDFEGQRVIFLLGEPMGHRQTPTEHALVYAYGSHDGH